MATPLGRNSLNIFRRHLIHCSRYPRGSKQPFTHKPVTAKDKKADSCDCPIWCLGYLAKETQRVNGRLKPKRVFASLGTSTWTAAESEIARLYERGSLPSAAAGSTPIDNSAITVKRAGDRFLTSRTEGSLNPVEKDTYEHYRSLIHDRLLPYCDEKNITYIREFENQDMCNQFTESWQQMRRSVGELLAMSTRKIMFQRFKTFLKYCVENDWMTKSGAKMIKTKQGTTAEEEERYGLELGEYQRLMDAPDSPDLTQQENQETRAATELMRWAGLRISDAQKFNDHEIVPNQSGDGWNADFIQKKTKRRCVSPLTDHLVAQLRALPGRMEGGKKYFFTCSYTALRMRVDTLGVRAQKKEPFKHPFSPHSLRHYAEFRTMPSKLSAPCVFDLFRRQRSA